MTAPGKAEGATRGCGELGRAGSVLGLRIPADPGGSVTLAVLALTASALSEAIGGGLLEDALTAEDGDGGYTFYVDELRVARGLRPNDRAAVLAARLGQVNRAWLADLRGDVLVLGADGRLEDVSVPLLVVEAAVRSGLFVERAEVDR
jgi:hypothetical protein